MPSVMFITEPENIPSSVGKNIFVNSRPGDMWSKSRGMLL